MFSQYFGQGTAGETSASKDKQYEKLSNIAVEDEEDQQQATMRITPRHRRSRASSLATSPSGTANVEQVPLNNVVHPSQTGQEYFQKMLGTIKSHASDFNLSNHLQESATSKAMQQRYPFLVSPAFIACFGYSLVSTSMILTNKLVLSTYKFQFPMVLLFHQNLVTVNSLYLAKEMGVTTYEPLEMGKVLRWLPMDVFFVIMLLTGFYSVQLLSVPMVTIFKNTNNILIAIGDALLFSNIPSTGVIWTLLLMLLAAVMAALNDLEYTYEGYVWTSFNCLSSTAFVLYAQSAMGKTQLSTFGKVYYNNVLSLPLILIADVLVFRDFQKLFNIDKEQLLGFLTVDFIFLWFLSGILGFLQSLSSLRAQHLTSPTTYSMVGSLNKIPLTFLGVYIFHSPMTWKGSLYVGLSILAGALYSYTKAKEDSHARQAKQAAAAAAAATANENGGGESPTVVRARPDDESPEIRDGILVPIASNLQGIVDGSLDDNAVPHLRHPNRAAAAAKNPRSKSMPTPMVDPEQVARPTANKL